MCFSPQASFGATVFLLVTTIFSYRAIIAQKLSQQQFKAKLGLILISASFALQQFLEGLVWLALWQNYQGLLAQIAIYGFIFFAFIFWPAYIPVAVLQLETKPNLRKVLQVLSLLGLLLALALLWQVAVFGVTAQVANCHIMYVSNFAKLSDFIINLSMLVYLSTTVGALLISSYPGMRIMGLIIGIAYLLAYWFYLNYLISVWCFFAAISSVAIYFLVRYRSHSIA